MSTLRAHSIHRDTWLSSDRQFDRLYPDRIRQLSAKHWTPIEVAKFAAEFLVVDDNIKVLDVGSGVGKFCLTAAHYRPNVFFAGIEQRADLVRHAMVAGSILVHTQLDGLLKFHIKNPFHVFNHR